MTIRLREGRIKRVLTEEHGVSELEVTIGRCLEKAIAYQHITGTLKVGDRVLLNTTACFIGLGTGGYHFVIANLDNTSTELSGPGHIMKLRYTPLQIRCMAVEEQQSKWHHAVKGFESLNRLPVLVIGLHSMLAPLCACIKASKPDVGIVYIMTDAAALPIAYSKTVAHLKNIGLIKGSVTCGNAFGGDYEAVNFYSGIIAAREVAKCDIAIIGMGPGIVGTGTQFGFSGIEQGYIIDGINTLGGLPIAVPRISYADRRDRHRGISHHTITVLKEIAKTSALLPLPELDCDKRSMLEEQIRAYGIADKHRVVYRDGRAVFDAMKRFGLDTTTMGRGLDQDPEFFMAVGAAAMTTLDYL
jgi:hypothetical protein